MAYFDNGRPPVTTDDGTINSVSVNKSKVSEAYTPDISAVSINNSNAVGNEVPELSAVTVSNSNATDIELPSISAVSINKTDIGRCYGGFL